MLAIFDYPNKFKLKIGLTSKNQSNDTSLFFKLGSKM